MDHQRDLVLWNHRIDPGVQEPPVLDKPVRPRPRIVQLVAVAHTDQVRRQQPPGTFYRRHHLAPQEGRGRVAVQEQHRRAPALSPTCAMRLPNTSVNRLRARHSVISHSP